MRTAAILRRMALAAGYAAMPFLLADVLHQPPLLLSGVVLWGYVALALCLAVERRPWLNALHASFFFLFVFLLSFLSAENFSMSPGEFCRFVLSPPEEYVSTTDIREFLAALVLLFPVVLGLFACWYAATASCARWMRRRIHGDIQRQADA